MDEQVKLAVKHERQRCLRCVEMAISMAPDNSGLVGGLLYRVRNQIANGQEPLTLEQQMEPPAEPGFEDN